MLKRIAITGATSGIGKATTEQLLKQGYELILIVRNISKAQEIFPNQNVHIVECDLSDLNSVKMAVAEIKSKFTHIDVLINNAGGAFNSYQKSKQGYELTFAMNHLGHFLLTTELIEYLKNGRIINVSSVAHSMNQFNILEIANPSKFGYMKSYGDAKLCNIYFTQSLHEEYNRALNICSYALHPGVVATSFGDTLPGFLKGGWELIKPLIKTPNEGASTSIYLATENGIENLSGKYFKNCKLAKPNKITLNQKNQKDLWELSEKLVKDYRG